MRADGKKRILVVDDQSMVSESLKMILEFDGYEVDIAENGRKALEIFEPEKFAVVFTDFEMPEMNGHELASIIKARHPRQPIIMVTAYADSVLDMQPPPQVDLILGKSNQQAPAQPQTLGEQIKKHRLELHWLQARVAKKFGVSPTSISNWERGITLPSRRMIKQIQEFLNFTPKSIPKVRKNNFCCQICGISNISPECCLFEKICNPFTENKL